MPGRGTSMRNGCALGRRCDPVPMQRRRRYRHQPVHVSQLAVQRDLILGFDRRRSIPRRATRSPRASRWRGRPADSASSDIRCIATLPSPQSGDCATCSGCVATVDRLRRAGDEPDAVDREAVGCGKRLDELQRADRIPAAPTTTSASLVIASVVSTSRLQRWTIAGQVRRLLARRSSSRRLMSSGLPARMHEARRIALPEVGAMGHLE